MVLMLDNYDSFTWNLVQYLGELGEDVRVFRNDEISVDEVLRLGPDRVVISPGPCTPNEAGISLELIRRLAGRLDPACRTGAQRLCGRTAPRGRGQEDVQAGHLGAPGLPSGLRRRHLAGRRSKSIQAWPNGVPAGLRSPPRPAALRAWLRASGRTAWQGPK
mgnify:CR=1 FL=1